MRERGAARPYARAAFEQARAEEALASWSELLRTLAIVAREPLMRRLLSDPRVGTERLLRLTREVCAAALHSATQERFVELLVRVRRLELADAVHQFFEERRRRLEGRTSVRLFSAYPLTDGERRQIEESLAQRLATRVESEVLIEASLIGGVRIEIGDTVIDTSLRNKLNGLAEALA